MTQPNDVVTTDTKPEWIDINQLHPHHRNYRDHPSDQVAHIAESIKENGIYRNVVIARDGTILAGHGIVKAAMELGMTSLPVIRLDIDPNEERALKIMIGDNEISRLSINDDRALTEMLKDLRTWNVDALLGTGFDEQMVAALTYVTRPASEIKDKNEAAQWVGMPEFDGVDAPLKITMSFATEADRNAFASYLGASITPRTRSLWWPLREQDDMASIRFEEEEVG